MQQSPLLSAIQQICDEKGISMQSVLETIEAALAAAYRKDYGQRNQNIKVEFSLESGDFKVYDEKTVVNKPIPLEDGNAEKREDNESQEIKEKVDELENFQDKSLKFNPKTEMQVEDAKLIKEDAKEGDIIRIPLEVHNEFGRMASQTAKQVIIQKLREAERQTLYDEFKAKEKEIMIGVVQRREGNNWIVDLGKSTALLPKEEKIISEDYKPGMKIKFYIMSVSQTPKGPTIIVSRSHPDILKKLFILEIPEISSNVVEIKALAREAGSRSKVAVKANDENIDPIGACVGQRGSRIQTIINEIGGEKVDIIEYNSDIKVFIANSLSPSKVVNVEANEKSHIAKVLVSEDQLSLAIGKAGQNVRLAAKLTGWKITIKSLDGKEFSSDMNAENEKKTELAPATAEVPEEVKVEDLEEDKKEAQEEEVKKESPKRKTKKTS